MAGKDWKIGGCWTDGKNMLFTSHDKILAIDQAAGHVYNDAVKLAEALEALIAAIGDDLHLVKGYPERTVQACRAAERLLGTMRSAPDGDFRRQLLGLQGRVEKLERLQGRDASYWPKGFDDEPSAAEPKE